MRSDMYGNVELSCRASTEHRNVSTVFLVMWHELNDKQKLKTVMCNYICDKCWQSEPLCFERCSDYWLSAHEIDNESTA